MNARTTPARPPRVTLALTAGTLAMALTAGCSASSADAPAEPASPTPAGNASAAGNGLIVVGAFDSDDMADLWSVSPDGSGLAQLTDTPDARELCADVSPDGTRLAFCRSADDGFEIWTSTIEGNDPRQLTDLDGAALFPDWSPQGDRIAFSWSQGPSGPSSLRLVDVASGEVTTLLEDEGQLEYPTFSPDGSKVLYVSALQLWTIDVESGQTTRLTSDDTNKEPAPDWSPDGTQIAYHANTSGDDDIWIMNADGTDQRNLTKDAGASEFGAAFSPDGQYIAFSGTGGPVPAGERYLQVMRTDGSERRVLVETPGFQTTVPSWQPLPQPTP